MASQYPVGFTPDAPAATAYPEGFTPAASPPTTPPAGLPGPTEMLQGLRGSVGKMLGKTPLQHAPEWYQELVNPVPGSLMEAGGLLGGGVAAKATRGWGPLNRILGGALGAEGGNLAAGGTPGQGALVGGVGLMHSGITYLFFDPVDDNSLGLNIGGGAIGFLSPRTGVRFEVRHFRTLEEATNPASGEVSTRLSFWRFTVGVVIRR